MFKTILTAAVVAGGFIFGSAASAATIQFAGSADGTDFLLTFSDDTSGQIDVHITATANPNSADLLGLGFDFGAALSTTLVAGVFGDFRFDGSNNGEGITGVCGSVGAAITSCGGGLNFNGTGSSFDYIVRMGDTGTPGGNALADFKFHFLTDAKLDALGDSFGIRAQTTGGNGEGSIKLVDFTLVAVPLPAGGLLLLTALAGAGVVARRRKTA